ncbi:MAG: Coenzyme F420 hydrogenase/dehydrogenase, beta subunit C-terminal domain [Methanosphaera sp.]|nr:Coenzyme F420 hydrogenase/dehydrogenase, beta subunit C-terminal domain [Methanosphaera sp.]
MELCKPIECTGCMACVNICPKGAITISQDQEGFYIPLIQHDKCVKCGKCIKTCPMINAIETPTMQKKVYGAWLKNRHLRKESTSGGAFTAFAKAIFKDKGTVYGVGYDDKLKVIHKGVERESNLSELRGSKYVQSYIGDIYKEVSSDLKDNRKVLFVGTACQVAGLYAFLGKRFESQLFTIDLVCHGVPSPNVFKSYLSFMEKKYSSNVSNVYFRNKKPGWYVFGMKLLFSEQKCYEADTYSDPFIRGFLRNFFLRSCCYDCKYANINRVADITLADFWGYQSTNYFNMDDDKGISMIMINSANGMNIFNQARKYLKYWEKTVEEAVNGNPALSHPFSEPVEREAFWKDYNSLPFEEVIEKYMYAEKIPEWFTRRDTEIKKNKRYFFRHIPYVLLKNIIGDKCYESIKSVIKR